MERRRPFYKILHYAGSHPDVDLDTPERVGEDEEAGWWRPVSLQANYLERV